MVKGKWNYRIKMRELECENDRARDWQPDSWDEKSDYENEEDERVKREVEETNKMYSFPKQNYLSVRSPRTAIDLDFCLDSISLSRFL